jgi:hypothetical protein
VTQKGSRFERLETAIHSRLQRQFGFTGEQLSKVGSYSLSAAQRNRQIKKFGVLEIVLV